MRNNNLIITKEMLISDKAKKECEVMAKYTAGAIIISIISYTIIAAKESVVAFIQY